MRPTTSLPEGFTERVTFDLSKNLRAQVLLTLAGLALFIVFGILFIWAASLLHPFLLPRSGSITIHLPQLFGSLFALLFIVFVVMVLHELTHGIFYWLFTRQRPVFGFKGIYAYAAAPNWYFPRLPFIIVGLAPLVLLTIFGLALLPILPIWLVPAMILTLTLNASGAVGDIFVVAWVLTKPATFLVRDVGDSFTMYGPQ